MTTSAPALKFPVDTGRTAKSVLPWQHRFADRLLATFRPAAYTGFLDVYGGTGMIATAIRQRNGHAALLEPDRELMSSVPSAYQIDQQAGTVFSEPSIRLCSIVHVLYAFDGETMLGEAIRALQSWVNPVVGKQRGRLILHTFEQAVVDVVREVFIRDVEISDLNEFWQRVDPPWDVTDSRTIVVTM